MSVCVRGYVSGLLVNRCVTRSRRRALARCPVTQRATARPLPLPCPAMCNGVRRFTLAGRRRQPHPPIGARRCADADRYRAEPFDCRVPMRPRLSHDRPRVYVTTWSRAREATRRCFAITRVPVMRGEVTRRTGTPRPPAVGGGAGN